MNCKYCGAEMLSNTKFCIKCGKNNDDASEKVILVNQENIEKNGTVSEEKATNSKKKFSLKIILIPVIVAILIASVIIVMVILPQNPKASYDDGIYNECISVSFSATNLFPLSKDADVYISQDDSEYTLYSGEEYYLNQIRTYSFKLYTINSAGIKSSEKVFEYIMDVPEPEELQVSLEPGTYTDYQSVEIISDDNSTIYYTIDGSVPSEESLTYTSAINLDNGTTVIKALAINEFGTVGSMKEWKYILDLPVPSEVSFSMEGGVYTDLLEIELSSDKDAKVYYTIDGTEPNEESLVYTSPIEVNTGIVGIKAVAINSYGMQSEVTEKQYVVTYNKYGEYSKTAVADAYYGSVGSSLSLIKYDSEMNEIQNCGVNNVLSLYSDGESIYYLSNGSLFKRNSDQEKKMIDMSVDNFALSQNKIYFTSSNILYSINLMGDDLKKYEKFLSCTIAGVWDGNIYICDSGKAFMISTDDEISELLDVVSNKYFIYGNKIYYINNGNLVCKDIESGSENIIKKYTSDYYNLDPSFELLNTKDKYEIIEKSCIDIFVCHKTLYVLVKTVDEVNTYHIVTDTTDREVNTYYNWYAVDLESGNVSDANIGTQIMTVFDNSIIDATGTCITVVQ